ncbi:MAG: RNA polymerase sigma factor [Solirubrobacterales bacterium]
MTAKTTQTSDIASDLEEMVNDQFLDGLIRVLERKFPDAAGAISEDAVSEAVQRTLEIGQKRIVKNPRGYVTAIAKNEVKSALSRAALETIPASEDEDEDWIDGVAADDGRSPEANFIGEMVYEFVRGLVDQWSSKNLKTATKLVLEGAFLGEPLSGEELAERLEDILDKDVSASTARQWRKRGLDRLKTQLAEEGFEIDD